MQAQQQLWYLIGYFHSCLQSLPVTDQLWVPQHPSKSPIFSLCTPQPRKLAKHCQERGFIVRPIVPPTVLEGKERIRVCLHAGNTTQDIDRLILTIASWLSDASSLERSSSEPTMVRARL